MLQNVHHPARSAEAPARISPPAVTGALAEARAYQVRTVARWSTPAWSATRVDTWWEQMAPFWASWNAQARAQKVTGASPPAHVEALMRTSPAAVAALEEALLVGLELREGRHLAPVAAVMVVEDALADWEAYLGLHHWRSWVASASPVLTPPRSPVGPQGRGLSVCDACWMVFRPKRKLNAAFRCARCAKHPAPPGLVGIKGTGEGYSFKARRVDADGNAAGWQDHFVRPCAGCGRGVVAFRSTARYCSGACREAARRARVASADA